jgi:2'-hydroxyisoflavone reductase
MASWLILGGTRFVGHHIAQAAIDAGHGVTLFHRGHTSAQLEGPYRAIHGDRDGGLDALRGTRWDAVIDVCGYLPRVVEQSLEALETDHYCFVSTVSVYPDRAVELPPIVEDDPLLEAWTSSSEEITEHSYGPLKVACERAVLERHPGATLIRPGYVVGPRDHTHRFSWWLRWLARPGSVLVPDNDSVPLQVIDARDLAAFAVRATEGRLAGPFDCVGPAGPLCWGDLYRRVPLLAGVEPSLVRVGEAWLVRQGITEGALPMWLAPDRLDASLIASGARARAAGLILRPLEDTVRDILAEPPGAEPPVERLSLERERSLLERWEAGS